MYRAMDSRDRRFDGRFFVAVKSTGIYCRPICPAPTPLRKNTRFYRHAAVAEVAGFRPCRRCRPEVSPDTAEWDTRADLVGRGLRQIAEGFADESGIAALADRLGVSERHLQRVFSTEIGATPGVIARSRRARLARQLLTETVMPISRVAFAAGFSSVRAFNETMSKIYEVTPTELRRGGTPGSGELRLSLQFRRPLAREPLLRFLGDRAVPGVEEVTDTSYRRSIRFGEGEAVIELEPAEDAVALTVDSDQFAPLAPVVQRARQLLDLDADPALIQEHLGKSVLVGSIVAATPGLRLVGTYDPFETGVFLILEQGCSTGAAAVMAGELVAALGSELERPRGGITHLFPTPSQIAGADLVSLGFAPQRAARVERFSSSVARGDIVLDGSIDADVAIEQLLRHDGLGARTAKVLGMRALRDPDAFPGTDAVVRRATADLLDGTAVLPAELFDQWRPWRAYAVMYLWHSAAGGD